MIEGIDCLKRQDMITLPSRSWGCEPLGQTSEPVFQLQLAAGSVRFHSLTYAFRF